MRKHAIVFSAFMLTVAFIVAGCVTSDSNDVFNESGFVVGATKQNPPSITNHYDGLTVYMKKKGKIYNSEKIIACLSSIGGFSVTEEDSVYKESVAKGVMTNTWAYTEIKNDGKYVTFYGNFEDEDCWKSKEADSFFSVALDTTSLSLEDYATLTNMSNHVSIYKTTSFDGKLTIKYNRINGVSESDVTDRASAIQAFNDLLVGLKSQ